MPSATRSIRPCAGGQFGRAAFGQPVASETRHDPTRHDRDQDDDRHKSEPPSQSGGHGEALCLQVHQQIGDPEDGYRHDHRQIAPVTSGDDLTGGNNDQNHRKRQIRRGRQPEWNERGDQADQSTEQPQTNQQGQWITADRKPPGPIRDGGQQKSGNGSHNEAKHHFVDVPTERIETARQCATGGQHADPDGQGGNRPNPGSQEERPESLRQHGRHPRSGHAIQDGAHDAPISCASNPSSARRGEPCDLGSA